MEDSVVVKTYETESEPKKLYVTFVGRGRHNYTAHRDEELVFADGELSYFDKAFFDNLQEVDANDERVMKLVPVLKDHGFNVFTPETETPKKKGRKVVEEKEVTSDSPEAKNETTVEPEHEEQVNPIGYVL